MASPQLGDGFTRIANEILDNISYFNFNGSQFRLLIKVWRLTYGFGRKDHEFSVSFMQELTGLSAVTVKKELSFLIKSNVLKVTKQPTSTTARRLSFNKNYEEWEGVAMAKKEDDGVYDSLPPTDGEGYTILTPESSHEVYDHIPQNLTLGYTILTPYKEKDLKEIKTFKESVSFDDFYSIYPRKISKQAALKAWTKLSKEKSFDPERIISNTRNFADTCKLIETKVNFIPHPSTYLNQKRYADYWAVDPEGLAKGKETKFDSAFNFLKNQLGGGDVDEERNNIAPGKSFGGFLGEHAEF